MSRGDELRPRGPSASTPDDDGPSSFFYTSQRLRLHAVDWGNPTAPTIILIHGGKDHARSWDWIARSLRDRYHVVAPDLRGHGDSEWATGSMYSLIDSVLDLEQLIDALDVPRAQLIGHSYGGAVTALYAGVFPERVEKLVAIEGLGVPPQLLEEMQPEQDWKRIRSWIKRSRRFDLYQSRRYASVAEGAERMRAANERLSAAQAQHLAAHGLRKNEDGSFTWKYDPYSRILSPLRFQEDELRTLRARIDCPTLLLHGSESWAGDPVEDGRAAGIREVRSACIAGAGHWPHHERFEEFLEVLLPFLDG